MQYMVTHCQGTFNFKESTCCFLLLCVLSKGPSIPYQFLENRNSRAACRSQDWGHETERMRGFPSMTFYFNVIYSATSLLLRIWIVFWPCDNCYSPSFVFAQLYFCCLKLPCMEIYKAHAATNQVPLFHSRLGSSSSFFSLTTVPRSRSKDHDKWRPNRDLVNTFGKGTEWLLGSTEVGKWGVMEQMAGKPHHFPTLLHHLFKVQGLSVSHQPCLQRWLNIIPGSLMNVISISMDNMVSWCGPRSCQF